MFEELTWLVPAAVLAGGVVNPRGGLIVLAACLPLFGSPPGGPYLAALDVAGMVAIGAALRAPRAPAKWLDRAVLVFVAVTALSLVPLTYRPPSWQPRIVFELLRSFPGVESWTPLYTWRAFANLVLGTGLYFGVRRAFAGRSIRPLGQALAAGCALLLALGFAERFDLLDLGAFRTTGGPVYETRFHSLFFHSGWLAEFLLLAVPVAAAALLAAPRRLRGAATILAVVAVIAIVLTEQRGAWFAALAQLGVLALFWLPGALRSRHRLVRAGLGAAAVALLLTVTVANRPEAFEAARERSLETFSDLSGRPRVWRASVEMASERPLLGWGVGSFASVSRHQKRLEGTFEWLTSHNHILMIAAERGLVGLGAFGLLCWMIVRALRKGLDDASPAERTLARGLVISLVGTAILGAVQYIFYIKMIEWLSWMLVGALAQWADPAVERSRLRLGKALLPVGALLLLWRAWAISPISVDGNRSFGFHRLEPSTPHDYEWTESSAVRRLAWQGETLVLPLVNGHPLGERRPIDVLVRIDGREVLQATTRSTWEFHKIHVGPPTRDALVLEIEAGPSFRPFAEFRRHPELEPSTDIRRLGVAVGPVGWEASASDSS